MKKKLVAIVFGLLVGPLWALDGVWSGFSGTDKAAPMNWADSANWVAGNVPSVGGQAFLTNALPSVAVYPIQWDAGGIELNRLRIALYKDNEGYLLTGGPLRFSGTNPRFETTRNYPMLHAPVVSAGTVTFNTPWGLYLRHPTRVDGPVVLEGGSHTIFFDSLAEDNGSTVRNYASTNEYIFRGGDLTLNARPNRTASSSALVYRLNEGSNTAVLVSGTYSVVAGQPVSADGLPTGTYVKELVGDRSLLRLSQTATNSGDKTFTAPAASFATVQDIRSLGVSNSSAKLRLNVNGGNGLRLTVGRLYGVENLTQMVSGGEAGFGEFSLQDASDYRGLLTVNQSVFEPPSYLRRLTATNAVLNVVSDAVVDGFQGQMAVTKRGSGTLRMQTLENPTLKLTVEAGGVEISNTKSENLVPQAAIHFDASAQGSFEFDSGTGKITKWMGLTAAGNNLTNDLARCPELMPNVINGLPMVDFGSYVNASSGHGLFFERSVTGVRTAFIVLYLNEGVNNWASFFGRYPGVDSTQCYYTRSGNTGGVLWPANTSGAVANGYSMVNGRVVVGNAFPLPQGNFYVISVTALSETTIEGLFADRIYHFGGAKVGEVLLFTQELSMAQQAEVEFGLRKKWLDPQAQPVGKTMDELTVKSGASIALGEGADVSVGRLVLEDGALVLGPGRLLVTNTLVQTGSISLKNGAGLVLSNMPSPTVPEAQAAPNPAFWVDACAFTNQSAEGRVDVAGGIEIARWNDVRGAGYNYATNVSQRPTLVTNLVNGLPMIWFVRPTNSAETQGLQWATPMNSIRAVFAVMDTSVGGANILGAAAGQANDFNRGSWMDYRAKVFNASGSAAPSYVTGAPLYFNGIPVSYTNGYYGCFQLVEVHPTANARASAFNDNQRQASQNGFQRLGEVIVYDRVLTEAERLQTEQYLMRKWFNRDVPLQSSAAAVQSVRTDSGTLSVPSGTDRLIVKEINADAFEKNGAGELVVDSLHVTNGVLKVNAGKLRVDGNGLPANSVLHLDASRIATVETNSSGRVLAWRDCSGGANFASAVVGAGMPAFQANALNGRPVVDFETVATVSTLSGQRFLNLDRPLTSVRDGFVVIGSQAGGNQLLGFDSGTNHFHRAVTAGGYASRLLSAQASQALSKGEIWKNDVPVRTDVSQVQYSTFNGVLSGFSGAYEVVSFASYGEPVAVGALANAGYGAAPAANKTGGQKLAEVVLYDRPLTVAEREKARAFLMRKWLNISLAGSSDSLVSGLEIASNAVFEATGSLVVSSFAGGGSVVGDLSVAEAGVIRVSAVGGTLAALSVSGNFSLAGSGTVVVLGDAASLKAGRFRVVDAGALSGSADGWTVQGDLSGGVLASLSTESDGLWLTLRPKATILILR